MLVDLQNFLKVKIKNTNMTQLQAQNIDFNGFTEVFFSDYTFVAGTNKLQFHTPYNWDGTSNIIVELSFSNTTTSTPIEFSGFTTETKFINRQILPQIDCHLTVLYHKLYNS